MCGQERIKQIAVLSSADWGVLFIAMLLLPATALALRVKGYGWTKEFIAKRSNKPGKPKVRANHLEAQRIARLVSVAANHGVYRANCLKKALVTQWLLLDKGIFTNLKIGVNSDLSVFSAHAWLEYEDHILNDPADTKQRFAAFEPH